jgi:heme/copper-type cytochrome/quinol oxidase subunit 2
MPVRLTDAIFWISAICCAVAQAAILRSVIVAPVHAPVQSSSSTARRATDIVWAVLPGLALAAVFVFTWRVMHGSHALDALTSAMQ